MDYAGLITKILLATGKNQTELARELDTTQPTISRAQSGARTQSDLRERIVAYARGVGILDEQNAWSTVPIVGYIGAAGEICTPDQNNRSKSTAMPPKPEADIVSVVAQGDDMLPKIENGDVVYYETRPTPIDDLLGRLCIIKLHDGRSLAKKIFRGSAPDTWNLLAPNGSWLMDQKVAEVRRIVWIKPA